MGIDIADRLPAVLLALALSSCAAISPQSSIRDVETLVSARGVNLPARSDDETARSDIERLLADGLERDEAVRIALVNNRRLRAEYERLGIAQADLVAAGLLGNPVLDGEARFAGSETTIELSLVQELVDIVFLPLRKRVAESAFEAAKLTAADEILRMVGDVESAYLRAQAAEQSLEMKRGVLSATEAAYEVSKRLRAAGNIRELDLLNERSLYEQSKIDVRSAELAVSHSREELSAVLGLWGSATSWRVPARLPELPERDPEAAGSESRAVQCSLQLAAMRFRTESAVRAIDLAGPFGLFGRSHLGASSEREGDGEWAVGPAISLPIPIFDLGQATSAAASAESRRLEALHEAAAVELRSRVRGAQAALLAARETATYHREVLLPLRHNVLRESQLMYNAMQIGANELLLAKQQQIAAGDAYVASLLAYWLARSELDLLLAGGSPRASDPVPSGPSSSTAVRSAH